MLNFLANSPAVFLCFIGIVFLIVGSFLNVVIARLPITLKQDWRKECYEYLELTMPVSDQELTTKRINILLPRSYCPKCNATLRILDNIPILSFIFLRGKCHFCKAPISIKYPLVELLTALTCVVVAWNFGFTWQTLAGCVLTCVLIVQSGIDLENKFIPDEITMPVLWLGIAIAIYDVFVNLQGSVLGAIYGYLILWATYWIFYIATKKEGMGYGDFKLLAMLGAWLGWQMLPFIIICSSIIGSIMGILMLLLTDKDSNTRIPFGPFLAIAGWIALLWGDTINTWYLGYIGLIQ